jgi:hypothetical protein
MTKTQDVINETIRDPKHSFRQISNCPGKPRKHRYERRKIREFIRAADWRDELDW